MKEILQQFKLHCFDIKKMRDLSDYKIHFFKNLTFKLRPYFIVILNTKLSQQIIKKNVNKFVTKEETALMDDS